MQTAMNPVSYHRARVSGFGSPQTFLISVGLRFSLQVSLTDQRNAYVISPEDWHKASSNLRCDLLGSSGQWCWGDRVWAGVREYRKSLIVVSLRRDFDYPQGEREAGGKPLWFANEDGLGRVA